MIGMYSFDKSSDDVFKIIEDTKCVSFLGPGENHVYTFNSMREFIHNYEDNYLHEAFDKFKKTHKNDLDYVYAKIYLDKILDLSILQIVPIYQLGVNHLVDRSDSLKLKALHGKQYTPGYNSGAPFPHDIENEIADAREV
ncbi:PREDICTED: uncharacterized protein LOC105455322 [Wasmannia auropunctata]|uniref:uncharacterized protein LOC105455322 n=1 Tax=Wasmannia auropunctata TaxID=64793 RepID=UPI0005F0B2AA|nr:PREDICTED: uncharacterized protein LOC105455322 [Wasmannia auropunctata]XP_011696860.1 PREDICTED: uncharacterized protein LOC105455322 [Wasmannia auropunctata]XP_011696861.1 PREDICTED: uncharacterized protein LOC105455322 [Wasmannia auropunctata]XP_011696862.1 PREDICTED: uncharacterized protein LOC105455322 [Wasmannia auropunctata]